MRRSIRHLVVVAAALAGCGTYHFPPDAGPGMPDGGVVVADGGPVGPAGDGGSGDAGGSPPARSCATQFRYHDAAPASVALIGEFNGWDATQTKLTGPDGNGDWTVSLTLAPGAYAYKFVAYDSGGMPTYLLDPGTPYTKFVGGIENSVVEVADCQLPALRYTALTSTVDGTLHAEAQYLDGAGAAGLDAKSLVVTLDGKMVPATVSATGAITVDATGLGKTKHRLVFSAADAKGHAAEPLHVPFWIEAQPFDFRDGLLYFAFTDRFRDGNPKNSYGTAGVDARANYEGGDFAGITDAIDEGYFDGLGVRTLWISPPNQNPEDSFGGTGNHQYTGYHGYWPIAGRAPSAHFGTLDEMKTLVSHAHAHGIRVIVDAVLNHVHQEHPYWQMHQNDGWFNPLTVDNQSCTCSDNAGCGNWGTARESCWFTSYLPDLDYTNFDALVAMIDDALFWAREVDVDGFRVDAVKHFKLAATRRLRGKLHDAFEHQGPLFYLVGETFDGDRNLIESFIGPTALHAQFDFPIYFALVSTLGDYSQSLRTLENATAQSDQVFGDAPMSPFLGNHDVSRFLSIAAGQLTSDPQGQAWNDGQRPVAPTDETAYFKQRLGLTFVATSPGVPLVYYGDEYGQVGAGDPDNRRFMKWSGYSTFESKTIALVQKLGAARHDLTALRRGLRRTLWIDDNLYVYARVSGSDVAIVALNRTIGDPNNPPGPNTTAVPVPGDLPLANGVVLRDRLGGPSLTVTNHQLVLNLPAHSSALYAP